VHGFQLLSMKTTSGTLCGSGEDPEGTKDCNLLLSIIF